MGNIKQNKELLRINRLSIIKGLSLLNKCFSCQSSITEFERISYLSFIQDVESLLDDLRAELSNKRINDPCIWMWRLLSKQFIFGDENEQ